MPIRSAGLLLYRRAGDGIEVFLVHPGGPYWARKDAGAWSIPKGLIEADEDSLQAARREFAEETGLMPEGEFQPLGDFRQPSGKIISVWACDGDVDLARFHSNHFEIEWPPRSGRKQAFPEADRAEWFAVDVALEKILKGQAPIVAGLLERLGV